MRIREAAFLAAARNVLGEVPQYAIAQAMGMHPATLNLCLRGKRSPTNDFIAQSIDDFGCAFDELFYIEGATKRPRVNVPQGIAA